MKKYFIALIVGIVAVVVCTASALAKEPFKTDPDGIVIKVLDTTEVSTTLQFKFPIYWPSNNKRRACLLTGRPKWLWNYLWSDMFVEPLVFIDGDERRSFESTYRGKYTYDIVLTLRTDQLTDNPTIQAALGYESMHMSPEVRLCDNLENAEEDPLCSEFFKDPFFPGSKRFRNTGYAVVNNIIGSVSEIEDYLQRDINPDDLDSRNITAVVNSMIGSASDYFKVKGFLRRNINPDDLEVWIKRDGETAYEKIISTFAIEPPAARGKPLSTTGLVVATDGTSFKGAVIDIRAVLGDRTYHHYINLCRESDASFADNFCEIIDNPFASDADIVSFVEMDNTYEIYAKVDVNRELYEEDILALIKSKGDDGFVDHKNYGIACGYDSDGSGDCIARIGLAKNDFEGNVAVKFAYRMGGQDHRSNGADVCESDKAKTSGLCLMDLAIRVPLTIDPSHRAKLLAEEEAEETVPSESETVVETASEAVVVIDDNEVIENVPSLPEVTVSGYVETAGWDADGDGGCSMTPNAVGTGASSLIFFILLALPIMVTRVSTLKRKK